MEDELKFIELLNKLSDEKIKYLLKEYINQNMKHSEYISFITELSEDYINKSNRFIEEFKRNVNALYIDRQFDYNVMKHVDINEKNWFWYARLLKCSEDENFPKRNFFQPTYLVNRVYNILENMEEENFGVLEEELKELKNIVYNLYEKYKR